MGARDMGAPGMGSTPSGPSFSPSSWQAGPSAPVGPPPIARPDPAAFRPPRSRLPAVLTAVAVGLVALVVAVGTVVAHRADQQVVTPAPPSTSTPHVTVTKDSIEFTSGSGTGRLTILSHTWSAARAEPGPVLHVDIRIECTSGVVDYDPFDFQTFDAAGNLYELAAEESTGQLLGVGMLEPGEDVTGNVAFVMPRGEVTLLMSNDTRSVTALKISS